VDYIIGKVATMNRQGKLLKKILKAKNINQADLARLLQISPSHLCKVMKGQRVLGSMKSLEAARLLGVPMETFFQ
jgi:transcriptional regulator with XRE-family HTH domain